MSSQPAPTGLVIHRVLPATPAAVFDAWTNPALLARWMSPFAAAEASLELRVGGAFRIVMIGPGPSIEHTGRYLVVEPPRRVVFTWVSPYTGVEPSQVSVTLRPHAEGTMLTLEHERLPAEVVESHGGGWGRILDQLAALLRTTGSADADLSTHDRERTAWT